MRALGFARLLGLLAIAVLAPCALAGLPGYVEWVIWQETEGPQTGIRTYRWVVGPYAKRVDCEQERDRLAAGASRGAVSEPTRFLCVPDTVNPRDDSRWR